MLRVTFMLYHRLYRQERIYYIYSQDLSFPPGQMKGIFQLQVPELLPRIHA